MIVRCDQCSTKFRLDDSRVTEAGVRVRCSKCKYIFVVKKEAADDEPDFDSILQSLKGTPEAEAGAEVPSWQASSAEAERSGDDVERESAHGREFPQDDTPVGDEPPVPFDPAAFIKEEEPAPVSSFSYDEIDFSLVRMSVEKEIAAEESGAGSAPLDDHFDFGEFEPEPEPVATASAESSSGAEDFGFVSEEESPGEGIAFNPADFISDTPLIPDEPPENEERDFLFEDEEPAPAFSFPSADDSAAFSEFDGSTHREETTAAEVAAAEEPFPPAVAGEPPFAVSRRQPSSMFPVAITAVAVIFILAIAGAGVYFLKEGPQAFNKLGLGFMASWFGLETKEEGKITIRNVEAFYIKNSEAGELFVIKGEAFNEFKKPRASIQVKGFIYGKNGSELAQKTIYCGNALTKEQLATLPMAKLEQIMNNQFGDSLANLGVPPGKTITFVMAIPNVPKEGAEYGVEVTGSTVAGQ